VPDVGRQHRIVLVIVEHEDFRKFALRPHRMDFEFAEQAADVDVLLGVQVLVTQDNDLVLDQRRFERLEGVRVHPVLEVEAVNLGAEFCAQPFDLERRCRGLVIGQAVGGDIDVHGAVPRRLFWAGRCRPRPGL
jgi:hypothetical protein